MKRLLTIMTIIIIPQLTLGQENGIAFTEDPMGWLNSKGFEISNSFDGTKNESKPAFLQYTKDFAADTNSNMSLDIALKYNPVRLGGYDLPFYLFPAIEWHRKVVNQDLEDPNSYNKVSGSLRNEMKFLKDAKPVLVNSFTVSNDFKDNELEMSFTTESTLFLQSTGDINTLYLGEKKSSFKIFPYIGMEQFWGMSEAFDDLFFFKTRAHIEIKPFPGELMTLDFNYTIRYQLTGNLSVNSPTILSTTAAFKVSKYFSINLDYDYGREPKNEFVEVNSLLLGLGIKI